MERESLLYLKQCQFFDSSQVQLFPRALVYASPQSDNPYKFDTKLNRTKTAKGVPYAPNEMDEDEREFPPSVCATALQQHLKEISPNVDFKGKINRACARKPRDAYGLPQTRSATELYFADLNNARAQVRNYATVPSSEDLSQRVPLGTTFVELWKNLQHALLGRISTLSRRRNLQTLDCLVGYVSFLIHANYHRSRALDVQLNKKKSYASSPSGKGHLRAFASQFSNLAELMIKLDRAKYNLILHPIVIAEFMESGAALRYYKTFLPGEPWIDRAARFFQGKAVNPENPNKVYLMGMSKEQLDFLTFIS
jgi:hypothetical protein